MTDVTLTELVERLDDPALVLLDVRRADEFAGEIVAPCDPRPGRIPGARHLDVARLLEAPSADAVRALVGAEAGTEVIAYCHSGSRSAMAVQVLTAAGYEARNYVGSWHEWSRDGRAARRDGPRLGTGDARRGVEERGAERPPLLVPRPEVPVGLLLDDRERLAELVAALREPVVEHLPLDLRVELHAPRPVTEPVRLARRRARRELDRAVGDVEAVVVPLERGDARREDAEDGILRGGVRQLDLVPPDLGRARRPDAGACRAGDELGAEADTEDRDAGAEGRLDERGLAGEPLVLGVLSPGASRPRRP